MNIMNIMISSVRVAESYWERVLKNCSLKDNWFCKKSRIDFPGRFEKVGALKKES